MRDWLTRLMNSSALSPDDGGSAGVLGGGDKGGAPPAPAGGGDKPFWDGFQNADVKAFMGTKNYASPEALATAYHSLSRLHDGAKDVIALPGDKATDADWGKFYTALGRPESADKYELQFGEGMTVDAPFLKFAKDLFFDMGLSGTRAQKAADKWQGYVKERMEALATETKTKQTADLEAVKTTWGKDWDTHVAAGQRAVKGLGLSDAELGALDSAVGSPVVMKLLAAVGRGIGREDSAVLGAGGGDGLKGINTPEQARAEIAKLQADQAFGETLFNPKHADHAANTAKWNALHLAAYPPVKHA